MSKTIRELEEKLKEASKKVKVGGRYWHFKNPDHFYTVVSLGIQEATENVCVLYKAEYADITFVRDLESWISKVEVNGKLADRFTLSE